MTPIHRRIGDRRACRRLLSSPDLRLPGKSRRRRSGAAPPRRTLSQGQHAVPRDARAAPKTMMRLLATATAATALLFSPTPGVLVLSPALTGPRTTFSVGPHAGESYERVWREDPQFCVWALEQPAPRAELEDFQTWLRSVWKSTSVSGAPDNSPRSHFLTMTRPCWLRRAVRDPHRHAIEQASRRWRGGRRVVKI